MDGSQHLNDTTPHMRGIPFFLESTYAWRRYNPAHAGNPFQYDMRPLRMQIQPRTCGESFRRATSRNSTIDTTPHMRGIQEETQMEFGKSGYSPAHAGNPAILAKDGKALWIQPRTCGDSLSGVCTACVCAIQPRTCGESHSFMCRILSTLDTAPHMRVIQTLTEEEMNQLRYNPAHAGNLI